MQNLLLYNTDERKLILSNNHICINNILTEKKTVLLFIPDDISIEEELYKEMEVNVNFYDKTKFEKMLKKH